MDAVVKVDRKLLEEIEKFIKQHKFVYSNKKQVVNLAIIDFLSKNSLNKSGEKEGKK